MKRWIVLAHPWHECYLPAMPHLMGPSDVLDIQAPRDFDAGGAPAIVLGAERCPEVWSKIARAPNAVCYETENLLARDIAGRARAAEARIECGGRSWLNYSRVNAELFGDVPFAPMLRRGAAAEHLGWHRRPIDVLFVGSINRRRFEILNALTKANVALEIRATNQPAFGDELAALLRASKIVLNVHYYEPGVFESFRVVPALQAGAVVVSEPSVGGEGEDLPYISTVPYDQIVQRCLSVLGREPFGST